MGVGMAVLKQIGGHGTGTEYSVSSAVTVLGRHDTCGICIPSPAISRHHFQITNDGSHYFIEDLSSRNGTLLNSKPIRSRMLLVDGDTIEVSSMAFKFLTRDSLSEMSGSWGVRAEVISLTRGPVADGGDDSVRRQSVGHGDLISVEELGSDSINSGNILARIPVNDGGAAWPVIRNSTQKLNFALRLLFSLRKVHKPEEIIARCLQFLFETFATAERISLVLRDDTEAGIRVNAAVSRKAGEVVKICLPVIRQTMQSCEALLFLDHARGESQSIPEFHTGAMRIVMAAPMSGLLGRSLGVVQVDTSNSKEPLTADNLELLVILMHVVSTALEHADDVEARLATVISQHAAGAIEQQRSIVEPALQPNIPGFRINRRRLCSGRNSRDFVDYFRCSNGRIACALCEISELTTAATFSVTAVFRVLAEAVLSSNSAAEALNLARTMMRRRQAEAGADVSVALLIIDSEGSNVDVSTAGAFAIYKGSADNFVQLPHGSAPDSSPLSWNPEKKAKDGVTCSQQSITSCQSVVHLAARDRLVVFTKSMIDLNSSIPEIFGKGRAALGGSESSSGVGSIFEARLAERVLQLPGDSVTRNGVAFLTIQRTAGGEEVDFNADTTVATSESGIINI